MNNHRMCKMVFDTLSKSSVEKESLGRGDRVTFEYYSGRYELHQLHFRKAREQLSWSFNNCHIQATQQRRYSLPSARLTQVNIHLLSDCIITNWNTSFTKLTTRILFGQNFRTNDSRCSTRKFRIIVLGILWRIKRMVTAYGNMACITRKIRNIMLESLHTKMVLPTTLSKLIVVF